MTRAERAAVLEEARKLREAAGRVVDRLDALTYSMQLKVSPEIHLEGLRGAIPQIRDELRAAIGPEEKP